MKAILWAVPFAFFLTVSAFAQTKDNATKTARELQWCFLGSISKNQIGGDAVKNCMLEGITYCQSANFDEQNCIDHVRVLYTTTFQMFQDEYYVYTSSQANGTPYNPTFFDMRKLQ